jgi:hypothetical protein
MADGFALSLQKGLRAALVANSGVTNLVSTRIYDEPPQDVVFPYVRFAGIETTSFDTDTTEGAEIAVAFECHSRSASGRVEAAKLAEAIKAALHRQEAAVTVSGYNLVELIFETYSVTRDSEGRGYTAVVALQAMLEETA